MAEEKEEKKPESILFLADETDRQFKKVEELHEFFKKEDRKTYLVENFTDIKFSVDSKSKLACNFGEGDFNFTKSGFERLCKSLKVPAKFVTRLPHDNLMKDILCSFFRAQFEKVRFVVKSNKIVGISNREEDVSSSEVVNKIFETNHKTIRHIGVNNDNLFINFTRSEGSPIVGDKIGFGACVTHNDSSSNYPLIQDYLWREVCSNGAVANVVESRVKFSRKLSRDKMFDLFGTRIEEALNGCDVRLNAVVSDLNNTVIPREELNFIEGFLAKRLGFKDEDKTGSKGLSEKIITKEDSTYYDLMNFITDYAKNFPANEKYNMEMLGGDIMCKFLSPKPLELFRGYDAFKYKMAKELAEA